MSGLDRKAARSRCEAATEGPWHVNRHDNPGGDINWQIMCCDYGHPLNEQTHFNSHDLEGPGVRDNALFTAHARTDLPAALDLLDRCEATLECVAEWERCPICWEADGDHADGCGLTALLAELRGE